MLKIKKKMTTVEIESEVSQILENFLAISFENTKRKIDNWGKVDNWAELSSSKFVFLEIEAKQKHPCTNVLKLRPYLEKYKEAKIFLIQVFFPNSPGLASNRGKLCDWTAEKLQKEFNARFFYRKVVIDNGVISDSSSLRQEIQLFRTLA
jgi:hypothetical protein